MGLVAVLETERGVALERVADDHNVLHRLIPQIDDPQFRLAGFIDWYGDTVFNVLQARVLAEEWSRLAARAQTPEEADLMLRILKLIERVAQGEEHIHLKFYGD